MNERQSERDRQTVGDTHTHKEKVYKETRTVSKRQKKKDKQMFAESVYVYVLEGMKNRKRVRERQKY